MTHGNVHRVSPRARRFRRTLMRVVGSWEFYLLILPAVIYVFLFNYRPMYGVQIAFKDYRTGKGIWGSPWVGLKHFIRFFEYPNCWKILLNTVTVSLWSLSTFPFAVILALLINELDHTGFKRTIQMITYAPHFISTVVLCGMVLLFLNRSSGVINNIIDSLTGSRVDFLGDANKFVGIYVLSGVWQNVGWGTIVYLAALSGVSPELHEAARIDGASRLQIVRHINVPCIAPTIIIMLILSCGSILSVGFEKIYLLQNPLNMDVSQVISTYTYEIGLVGGQFSYSSAIGLFNTVVNILFMLIVNQIAKKVSDISIW